MRNIHAPKMAYVPETSTQISAPNVLHNRNHGVCGGKHEEPYIYTCPFHMPRKEIDPKNTSSL